MTAEDIAVEEGLNPVFHLMSGGRDDLLFLCGAPELGERDVRWPYCRTCYFLKYPSSEYRP